MSSQTGSFDNIFQRQLLEDIFRKLCLFVFPGASGLNSFAKVTFQSALPR